MCLDLRLEQIRDDCATGRQKSSRLPYAYVPWHALDDLNRRLGTPIIIIIIIINISYLFLPSLFLCRHTYQLPKQDGIL